MFEHLAQGDKERWERERGGPVPARVRPRKDPLAPKKPLTAFFLFASSYRPQLRTECPGLSVPEQAKKLGQKWSEQSPEARRPFELRAAVLKEKYEAEVAAYQSGVLGQGEPVKKEDPGDGDKTQEVGAQDSGRPRERLQKHEIEPHYSGDLVETQGLDGHHSKRPQKDGGAETHGLDDGILRNEVTDNIHLEARPYASAEGEKRTTEAHCSKEGLERKLQMEVTPAIEDIRELSDEDDAEVVGHPVMRVGIATGLAAKKEPEEEDAGEDDEEMEEDERIEDGT